MSDNTQQGGGRKTILLVEDDEQVRSVTRFILTQLGYDVLEAQGGPEALDMLEKGSRVDMLLTDVGLPDGINGAELVKRVRKYQPGLPTLLVSAYDDETLEEFGTNTVDASLLRKPYLKEELEREIARVLDRREG
jgi:CheY-like chemotaxis protein